MTTPLQLLPAVDVQDGQAVRLVQGAYGTATNYGNPFDAAMGWQEAGAEWLHLVDLDAAFGHGNNREIIRRITSELGIKIELSGGLRDRSEERRVGKEGTWRGCGVGGGEK